MHSTCEICGKYRNQGNHAKCSRIKQRMFAPGTALRAEQEATQRGRKNSYVWLPLDVGTKKVTGVFSRMIRSDS